MKLSDAIFRTLTGDGTLTGRDEKGLYAKYDAVEIPIGGSEARLLLGKVLVGTLQLSTVMAGDTVVLHDLDGRLRITLGVE